MKTGFNTVVAMLLGIASLAFSAQDMRQIPVDDMDNWYCEYFAGGVGPVAGLEGPRRGRGWAGAMVFDAYGNGYVAGGSTVFVYTSDDQIHRVAGIGIPGAADGSGDLACLAGANAIACHPTDGILYVSDFGNKVIKKIVRTPDGRWKVTTVAGQAGQTGHQDGPGRQALLKRVDGIALDSKGNLYMMDQDWLRRLSPDGQLVTLNPKGGTGEFGPGLEHDLDSAKFNRIVGAGQLACDENDNLLVADKWNGTFVRVDFKAGKVVVLAGGPARGQPEFRNKPYGVDGPGNTVAIFHTGGGPGGLAYDRLTRRVYTTTADEHAIRAIMPDGMVKTLGPWTHGPHGRLKEGLLKETAGSGWIAGVDTLGRVYMGNRSGMIYRFYRKPAIEGAPALKTPNPLLPWPVATMAEAAEQTSLKLSFDAPAINTPALSASKPVNCAASREAVSEFSAEVAIGGKTKTVSFASRMARIGETSLAVTDELSDPPGGFPGSRIRADFRPSAKGKVETIELAAEGANPTVISDGKGYVVAYELGNAVRVKRVTADGKVLDAAPNKMGGRWENRPAMAFNGDTLVVTAACRPNHNPWGWGGPGATSIGRLTADGQTPDNIKLDYSQICQGGYASLLDRATWKGHKSWPAGLPGGFKDTEDGYWPGVYTSVAWDGKSWVVAWTRYRVRTASDTDIFACRVDPATMMATSGPILVAGGADEPGAQTSPALAGLGDGYTLLVYQEVRSDGHLHIVCRLLSGGPTSAPARPEGASGQ